MVYCTRCGANNAENHAFCSNCGASLYGVKAGDRSYWRHRHYRGEYYSFHRGRWALTTLIVGVAIVFMGFSLLLSEAFNIRVPWWEIILILIGFWLITRAILRMKAGR
ncbi:MAG: zinc-ribbon domain-containing protein [Candidatus Bathyarchaeia archaeon]